LVRCASPPDSVPEGRSRRGSRADLDERVERLPQALEQRRDRRLVEPAHPLGEVADLHRAGVGDVDARDLRRARRLAEPRALALGAGREGDRPLDEGRMCGCIASTSFDRNDFWICGIRPS
jgi:hypothetical protein